MSEETQAERAGTVAQVIEGMRFLSEGYRLAFQILKERTEIAEHGLRAVNNALVEIDEAVAERQGMSRDLVFASGMASAARNIRKAMLDGQKELDVAASPPLPEPESPG